MWLCAWQQSYAVRFLYAGLNDRSGGKCSVAQDALGCFVAPSQDIPGLWSHRSSRPDTGCSARSRDVGHQPVHTIRWPAKSPHPSYLDYRLFYFCDLSVKS